jgi:riboflavin synthase
MFTGIIQGVAQVSHIQDQAGLRTLRLKFPKGFADGLQMGASVACDGVCLTVTQIFNTSQGTEEATFDVMQQTLAMTTLGNLTVGSGVHVERAAREGAEIGGHCLSGHIDFTASITQVRQSDNNHVVRIGIPRHWMQYLFPKGYLAIHGASLTMADVGYEADGSGWAEVWLIPETLRLTTFGQRSVGLGKGRGCREHAALGGGGVGGPQEGGGGGFFRQRGAPEASDGGRKDMPAGQGSALEEAC